MLYHELPPFRPPTEAFSLLLRATRNCPWGRCEFCSMYGGNKLEIRPVEDVLRDIRSARELALQVRGWAEAMGCADQVGLVARANGIPWLDEGAVTSAFIGDSDSIVMKTPDLVRIVGFLREAFPRLKRVTSYARAKTLVKKSHSALKSLREAGLTRLHVGLESGDDFLLRYVNKGASAEEMVIGGRKAMEAGFELSEYVMAGLGGRERSEAHIRETARVLNRIDPHYVRVRTFDLGLAFDTTLYHKKERGEFTMQSKEELALEVRTLLRELTVSSRFVVGDFASNFYLRGVDGKLPEDRDRMLASLETCLEWLRNDPRYRSKDPTSPLAPEGRAAPTLH